MKKNNRTERYFFLVKVRSSWGGQILGGAKFYNLFKATICAMIDYFWANQKR